MPPVASPCKGTSSYSFGGVTGGLSGNWQVKVGSNDVDLSDWAQAETDLFSNLNGDSAVQLSLSTASLSARTPLEKVAGRFFSSTGPNHLVSGTDYAIAGSAAQPVTVYTSVNQAAAFLQYLESQPEWSSIKGGYPTPAGSVPTTTVTTQTLIRSGTGSINLSAAGNIDLRNGVTPTIVNSTLATLSGSYQRGGVPIYNAGVPVTPGLVTAIDTNTGQAVTLDPSAFATSGNYTGALDDLTTGTFKYGYGVVSSPLQAGFSQGLVGVLVSNTLYLDDGGDITLTAGGNVLGRRDAIDESTFTNVAGQIPFAGFGDQPWRTGSVGAYDPSLTNLSSLIDQPTNLLVDPQMFLEGLGALGGGNVTVKAGGNVSDLTIVSDTSVTTGHRYRCRAGGAGQTAASSPSAAAT